VAACPPEQNQAAWELQDGGLYLRGWQGALMPLEPLLEPGPVPRGGWLGAIFVGPRHPALATCSEVQCRGRGGGLVLRNYYGASVATL